MAGEFVTEATCSARTGQILNGQKELAKDIKKLDQILRGTDMRSGLIGDVDRMMQRNRLIDTILGVVIGVATTVITGYIAGLL